MTAAIANRDTKEIGLLQEVAPIALPVAAATTIFAGTMVFTDAAGNAVPGNITTALRAWGRCEKQVVNTVAAGFGTAGALTVEAQPGVFPFVNGDAITAADAGKPCYAIDDQTVVKTAGAGRPYAGVIFGLTNGEVRVGIGPVFGASFHTVGS